MNSGFVHALGLDRVRRPAHEPGRVAVDLAVLLADGGEAISDLAVLRQQFSVGVAIIQPIRAAILAAAEWVAALDGDGSLRDGVELVALTDYLDPGVLTAFPAGRRTRSATAR